MFKKGIIELALLEDIGTGDITTAAIVPEDLIVTVNLLAKDDLVLAGLAVTKDVFADIDPDIKIETSHTDGDAIRKGDIIASVTGDAASIMTAERTALNFLQRLSGIATLTARYVKVLEPYKTQLVDTRKTTPGLRALEKYAVRCGGGQNHRFGLFGGIMIKDNHIDIAGSISEAVKRVRNNTPHYLKIEVETATLEQVEEALEVEADIIMLDNMGIGTMRKAVNLIQGHAVVEVSGQVDLDNIEAIARLGVDFISVGSITHSAKAADISLLVSPS